MTVTIANTRVASEMVDTPPGANRRNRYSISVRAVGAVFNQPQAQAKQAMRIRTMKRLNTMIRPYEKLLGGYRMATENALALLDGSQALVAENPQIALALAQIGLEELGKAYLLLHAGSFGHSPSSWQTFWSAWRNHERKSGAGFMFEWFNPVQFQIAGPDGKIMDGFPIRASFLAEKNAGLYVDYDHSSARFLSPRAEVAQIEALSRIGALILLANTAFKLYDTITAKDVETRFTLVSGVVAKLEARFTPQQDVHKILDAFALLAVEERSLLSDLREAFPACWRAVPKGGAEA